MASDSTVLREATFRPRVVDYWLLSGVIILVVCIVTIPLAPFWYFLGRPLCLKYLAHMSCTLTARDLQIRKGWLNRVEKTIPLEKITDLAMFQGPIMRAMDLKGFRVETAGGSSGATGYLVSLVGIEQVEDFRAAVLEQRDRLAGREEGRAPAGAASAAAGPDAELLEAVRSLQRTVERIERHLAPRD